jgi:ribose transport system ATP-binding protein
MENEKNNIILSLKNIKKTYPGVQALDNVSIDVYQGEVLALLGENGAGKSTLIKIITGAITPTEGSIEFKGKTYKGLTPFSSQNIGIAAIYQEFTLASTLTVAENIFLGQKVNNGLVVDKKKLNNKALKIIKRLKVNISPSALVSSLSVAEKQIVEIAKALSKDPEFIIMDEPTAPLTDNEVDTLFDIVNELKSQGITIIYISHRLDEIYKVADRAVILRDGKYITSQLVENVTKDQLIFYMVGRELNKTFPNRKINYGANALTIKNLSGTKNEPVSFNLKQGEILGLGGLVGAGRTELVRLIFGADKKLSGEIYINDNLVEINHPWDAVKHGIGYVSEDRKELGVLLRMSISDNITLPILKKISDGLVINKEKEKAEVEKQIEELKIKTPSSSQKVVNLSGGNQQKVVLGKWLASDVQILILDEPTRGIDVGNKQEIYYLINKLAESGKAIIVVSSEMEELLGLTDRLLILYEGKFIKELNKNDYSQELVLRYASGEIQ